MINEWIDPFLFSSTHSIILNWLNDSVRVVCGLTAYWFSEKCSSELDLEYSVIWTTFMEDFIFYFPQKQVIQFWNNMKVSVMTKLSFLGNYSVSSYQYTPWWWTIHWINTFKYLLEKLSKQLLFFNQYIKCFYSLCTFR